MYLKVGGGDLYLKGGLYLGEYKYILLTSDGGIDSTFGLDQKCSNDGSVFYKGTDH